MIISGMKQATQHQRGTAYQYFSGSHIDVAGKTGTAQVFGLKQNEKYEESHIARHLRDHSLFVAFAPVDNPQLVIVVVLENQRASAKVARQVLEAYKHVKPIKIPIPI